MQEAICRRCGKKVHRNMSVSGTWYDEGGYFCGTGSSGREHDPGESLYTLEEIRAAWKRINERIIPVRTIETLTEELEKGREPDYPAGTVWEDSKGVWWLRIGSSDGRWQKFGSVTLFLDDAPVRPLKQVKG